MSPTALAAEVHRLRELVPAFGVRSLRRSIADAAKKALEVDDPETQQVAAELLRTGSGARRRLVAHGFRYLNDDRAHLDVRARTVKNA